ncbi:hypothetical protein [Streptomyces sp. UG1]|uniref:hypothetical protein n=1 Tax=Streptomyces sp. UG1 TaxID=3417652 RepID=UPI003CF98DB4
MLRGSTGKTASAWFIALYYAVVLDLPTLLLDADATSQCAYDWFKVARAEGFEIPANLVVERYPFDDITEYKPTTAPACPAPRRTSCFSPPRARASARTATSRSRSPRRPSVGNVGDRLVGVRAHLVHGSGPFQPGSTDNQPPSTTRLAPVM